MADIVTSALGYAIYLLIIALAGIAVEWIRQKIGVEKMKAVSAMLLAHQELFMMGVSIVEQKYKLLHGQEKVNKAIDIILKEAQERGVKITYSQVVDGIEWAVRTFKDQFGEDWAGAVKD
jgi:hypothetical protein